MLTRCLGKVFSHNEQSVRVVERLEKNGKGLNLTWEVRDGMLNHKTSLKPATLEGDIVRLADKIAYVNHDIDDGIRAGVLTENQLPKAYTDILGHSTSERINTVILDVIRNSENSDRAKMSDEVKSALFSLREYMFKTLYCNPTVKAEEVKAERIIETLFRYLSDRPEEMSQEFLQMIDDGEKPEIVVCDYIAGMTDNFAIEKFEEFYIPRGWSKL